MRSTLDELQPWVLAETEWLSVPLGAALAVAVALLALVILTSMTLPTDARRAVSRRARLHRAVLSKISTLSAWMTLAFACLAVWRLLRLSAEGPGAALTALRTEQTGLIELIVLAGCLAIAFAARWHRELIAGATHFTIAQAVQCQAIRLGFLAAPLLLANLFSLA